VARSDPYKLRRYHLTLSSFAGIVFSASHWWCRIRWVDDEGEDQEMDAEHGRGDSRTGRFETQAAARSAGLRLVRKIASGFYVVTEGSNAIIDPQPVLSAPGNLKRRLNLLYRKFEDLDGWDAPKARWPEVQKVCDSWSRMVDGVGQRVARAKAARHG
jgi:hypothetical protein